MVDKSKIIAGVRSFRRSGRHIGWQPKITVQTGCGDITHYADGVVLVSRRDAMETAKTWRTESLACGYITN